MLLESHSLQEIARMNATPRKLSVAACGLFAGLLIVLASPTPLWAQVLELKEKPKARFEKDKEDIDLTKEAVKRARDAAQDTSRVLERAEQAGFGGFRYEDLRSPDIGLWFDRGARDGLVISDIGTRGVITKFGFRPGDRIISVNGRPVAREADFLKYVFADDVREKPVKVILTRDGREEVVVVRPAALVEEYVTVENDPLEHFGIVLDDRYPDRLVVWRVLPRSPAFYAGVRPGDTIVSFRGQQPAGAPEFVTLVQKTEPGPVSFEILRDQKLRKLEAELLPFVPRSRRPVVVRDRLFTNTGDPGPGRDPALERAEELRQRAGVLQDDARSIPGTKNPVRPSVPSTGPGPIPRPPRP
jgi:hypothetical protein